MLILPPLPISPTPNPLPFVTTILFSEFGFVILFLFILFYYLFYILHMSEIILYLSVCLISQLCLPYEPSRSIHVVAGQDFIPHYGRVVLHCVCVCVRVYKTFPISYIHSSVDGFMCCFHMNIGVRVSFQISVFMFFWLITRSGIFESYGSSKFFEEFAYCFPQ